MSKEQYDVVTYELGYSASTQDIEIVAVLPYSSRVTLDSSATPSQVLDELCGQGLIESPLDYVCVLQDPDLMTFDYMIGHPAFELRLV